MQDVRRLDFVDVSVTDGWNGAPALTLHEPLGLEFLSAPGTNDDIGCAPYDLVGVGDNALFRAMRRRQLRKAIIATGDADEFRDPANTGNHWIIPLLEVDSRAVWQDRGSASHVIHVGLKVSDQGRCFRCRTDHRTQHRDHGEDFLHGSLVENVHGHAAANQLRGYIGLQIGKPEYEVGLKLENPINLCRGERRNPWLFLARLWWTHGEPGNTNYPVLFAEKIERFGGFLGETHDALRKSLELIGRNGRCLAARTHG